MKPQLARRKAGRGKAQAVSGSGSLAKKALVISVKLLIAFALIYWLLHSGRLDFSSIASIGWGSRTVMLILAGTLSVFVGLVLLAMRLLLILRCRNISVDFKRCLGVTLVSSFFGAVLPGLVGGDIVKAVYLCSDAEGCRSQAIAAVAFDRMLGLYSLFLLGSLAVGAAWLNSGLPFQSLVFWVSPLAVLAATAGSVVVAWSGLGRVGALQKLYRRMPQKAQNVVSAYRSYLRHPSLLAKCIGLAVVNHCLVLMSFVTAAELLSDNLPVITGFVLSPIAMVMNVVPLTPGGIGITEGTFSFLYQAAGSINGASIGLLGRAIQYAVFAMSGVLALVLVRMRSQNQRELSAIRAS